MTARDMMTLRAMFEPDRGSIMQSKGSAAARCVSVSTLRTTGEQTAVHDAIEPGRCSGGGAQRRARERRAASQERDKAPGGERDGVAKGVDRGLGMQVYGRMSTEQPEPFRMRSQECGE